MGLGLLTTLTAVGTGISAYGAYQEGEAQKAAYEQRARAAIAEGEAQKSAQKQRAKRIREEGRRLAARQKTAYAKNNVISSSGSPLLIQSDTAKEIQEEAQFISREGDYALQRGQSRASFERAMGRQARRSAKWKIGRTILTGASRIGELF